MFLWCSFRTEFCADIGQGKCCVIDWKSQGILFWKTCMNPAYCAYNYCAFIVRGVYLCYVDTQWHSFTICTDVLCQYYICTYLVMLLCVKSTLYTLLMTECFSAVALQYCAVMSSVQFRCYCCFMLSLSVSC